MECNEYIYIYVNRGPKYYTSIQWSNWRIPLCALGQRIVSGPPQIGKFLRITEILIYHQQQYVRKYVHVICPFHDLIRKINIMYTAWKSSRYRHHHIGSIQFRVNSNTHMGCAILWYAYCKDNSEFNIRYFIFIWSLFKQLRYMSCSKGTVNKSFSKNMAFYLRNISNFNPKFKR